MVNILIFVDWRLVDGWVIVLWEYLLVIMISIWGMFFLILLKSFEFVIFIFLFVYVVNLGYWILLMVVFIFDCVL